MVCSLPKNLSPHFGLLVFLLLFLHCQAMVLYGEDIELATRLVRIAESLISGHPNEHTLRARLSTCICSVTSFVEPSQALIERSLNGFKSAQIVGDVDRAMLSSLVYCLTYIYCIPDLVGAQRKMEYFLQQSVRYICICFHRIHSLFSCCFLQSQSRLSTDERLSYIVSCVSPIYSRL